MNSQGIALGSRNVTSLTQINKTDKNESPAIRSLRRLLKTKNETTSAF